MDEWTRCSDRMPKKEGYYLITCDDDEASMEVAYFNGKDFEIYSHIAWMELPEPYRE